MPPTPTLHFFCGKAGAGKTTVATDLAQEHGAILISEDVWMMRLFGDREAADTLNFILRAALVLMLVCKDDLEQL